MDRESYRRGFEDALESAQEVLRREGLLTREIKKEINMMLRAVKENKINKLLRDLGLY